VPIDDLFLRACRREPTERTPVWFMRQAGRYQASYRELRQRRGILEISRTPELAARVTVAPVTDLGVDAAILFSDIMVPVAAMGVAVRIEEGTGPVVDDPVRSASDVDRVRPLDPEEDVPEVLEAVRQVVKALDRPLIGFAGAPFTLASYLVEGGPSKDYARTKAMMISEPELWDGLCSRLADLSATFLRTQVAAGAAAVQLFDSWAGSLSAEDYARYAQPYSARVLGALADTGVPRIHFGVGTAELLGLMGQAGAEVVGVDWRLPLAEASRRIGPAYAVQGNLDPALLSAPWPVLAERVRQVVRSGAEAPGHIFNLGHGVPPEASPDALARIVDLVHTESPALRAEAGERLA
jgi:uroporphyrinogen decarboxylase